MELTDNMKEWLEGLYDEAIQDADESARTEDEWAAGAPDKGTRIMHEANAAEMRSWIEALEELKDNIQFL